MRAGRRTADHGDEPAARAALTTGPVDFERFYLDEYRPLLRLAWSLTGRRDLGEELVQETMLAVHGRWHDVGGYDAPGAYARRVLLNACRSFARRRAVEVKAMDRVARPGTVTDPRPPDDELWAAVRDLPERQCQAVALHYLEDRPVAEIADVLGITVATTKVHLHRGRQALAARLGSREEER
ncbi:RNA polymerase sigma factor [Actinomarinicola tropica]|uniref:Sigma-70 family RNA polymerase sigma factor n=1 Tax=Actinomarinicola tropica TaxID=2789776 RepID=A0A5Q2RF23_9ACTN|nr:sigma-70 family RNA polymerase sigma factor [Actinomarinicola tropica]QGG95419.1 sigma-70 family RNA polymerase sigma factor [Actinomarinicola tropica]